MRAWNRQVLAVGVEMPSEMAKMAFEEFELFHNSFESVASEPGLFRSSEPDVSDEVWTFADAYRF